MADEAVQIGRPPARESYLVVDKIIDGRQAHRRAGDPSRLRLPVGERRLRRGLRRGRHRLHRPAAGGDPRDGLQERGQDADGEGRRAAGAGLSRRRPGRRELLRREADAHRLPGADQGRRPAAAARACAWSSSAAEFADALAGAQARGEGVVRRRPRADREVSDAAAPHRDPGVRRHARQRASTCSSATARCSAATRR